MKTLNRRGQRSAKLRKSVSNTIQALERRVLFAGFTAGDLAVELVGPGEGSGGLLTSAATPVSIQEYTTAGALQSGATVSLPTATGGASNPLTDAGSTQADGYLTLSANGEYLVMPGYDAAAGTSSVASATNISGTPLYPREIGRIDSSGNINTSTTFSNAYEGGTIRSVASIDGTSFWTGGSAATASGPGVQYIALGGTTATQISSTTGATTDRNVELFNGQLYVSAATSVGPIYGVAGVGTGLPTSSGQPETQLTPGANTASTYSYVFANATTLYLADSNTLGTGGIQKWVYASGAWSLAYSTLAAASNNADAGLTGLTMDSSGNLYGTTSATNANRLVQITDNGSAATGFTFTTLATAPTNEVFRGVALAPQATPTAPVISIQPTNQAGIPGSNITFTAASYGTPIPTVQWYQSIDHGTSFQIMPGQTSSSITLSSVTLSENGYEYEAKFTSNGLTTTSSAATMTVATSPQFNFDAPTYTVNENAGTVTIAVDRTGDTSTSVSVVYTTTDGTATAGANYTSESHTLTFPASPAAGYGQQTFTIPILAQYPQNSNKTFTVTLSNPLGDSSSVGSVSSTTVSITDVGEVFNFGTANFNVDETSGMAAISIVRSDIMTDSAAKVSYATSNGTATSSNYTATSGTVTFAAGQEVAVIEVPILDATQTQNVTFTVTLSNATAGAGSGLVASIGSQGTTTETIINAAALTNNLSGAAASDTDIEDTGPYAAGWTLIVGDATQYPGTELGFDEMSILEFSPTGSPGLYPAAGYAVTAGGLSNMSLTMETPTDASYHALITGNFNVYYIPDSDTTTNTNNVKYNTQLATGLDPEQFVAAPQLLGTFSFQENAGAAGVFDTYTPASLSTTVSNEIIADLNSQSNFRLAVTPEETGVGAISTRIEGVFTDSGGNVLTPTLGVTATEVQTAQAETLALANTTYSVNETAGTANITLSRTGATNDTATVTYTLTDGTALEGTNYGVSGTTSPQITGTATFGPGSSSTSFNVPIIDVVNQQGDKALTITLSNPASNSTPGPTTLAVLGQSTAVLTIKDSNDATVPLETLSNYAFNEADVETIGPYASTTGTISFKIASSQASFPSYAVGDFNNTTSGGSAADGTYAYEPTKTITAINSISLDIFNTSGGTSGLIDVYLVPDSSSSIAPGTTQHEYDVTDPPEGLDYSGTNSFGTPLLLGKINWNANSAANTFFNLPLLNYTQATASTLIADLNSNGADAFRIVATPEDSAVAANWGSLAGTFDGNSEAVQVSFGVQEGTVNVLPTWLATGSNATWTAGTHSLVVHGAATIIADPGSDEPVITTDGGTASVLTINPASGRTVHIGGLILTGGASAIVDSVGAGRAAGTERVLIVAPGTNNFSITGSGKLDLQDNDAIFQSASSSTITPYLKTGFNAHVGYWNGAGIVSSTAAADTRYLTTLGTAPGSVASGGTFDTVSVSASDVLVKFTYYGDANLTGTLNGADYQQIDAGFGSHATIWSMGDFNYDGAVDGSDFSLIDNAFNQVNAGGASPLALIADGSDDSIVTQLPGNKKAAASVFSAAAITNVSTGSSTTAEDLLNGGQKTLVDEVLDAGI